MKNWIYKDQEFDTDTINIEDYAGFVYLITNNISGKKYIGKKLFWSTRKLPPLKGQKRRRTKKTESDWKEYWSSSDDVKNDVKELGEENFKREILHLVKTKGTASYYEAKEQMLNEVLENPDQWYNGQIQCRVHRSHIKK